MPATFTVSRRSILAVLAGTPLAIVLAGCSDDEDSGQINLTMTWWGNDQRLRITQDVITAFQSHNAGTIISGTSTEGSGYWDKLSTQIAANDAPDIIQMDEKYLATYSASGALYDLSKTRIGTKSLAGGLVEAGTTADGLTGLAGAINTPVVVVNPALFQQAGVNVPDDATWTWDDYARIAQSITDATGGSVIGSSDYFSYDFPLSVWARQHGTELYNPKGGLAVSAQQVAEWYSTAKAQSSSGAVPESSAIVEALSLGIGQSPFATGKAAMVWVFSNQVAGLIEGLGSDDVRLLRPPTLTGRAADAKVFFRPSVFWSVSSRSKHPEQAAQFLDFLVNTPEAGKILSTERGIPANTEVLAAIRDGFDKGNMRSVDYVEKIAGEVTTPPPPPPNGLGTFPQILQRHLQSVLFDKASPQDAADATLKDAAAASKGG